MARLQKMKNQGSSPNKISVDLYGEIDEASIVKGISDLQEIERNITDTRRSGNEIAPDYFKQLKEKAEKKSGAIFVAKAGNKVIGFISCWVRRENDIAETKESNICGYISDAYVVPEFRNKGIFGRLNEKAEEHLSQFEEVKLIRISVLADNAQALKAYGKVGYKPEEISLMKKLRRSKFNPFLNKKFQ